MKILFAGTPAIAVPALAALTETGLTAAVLTNPDRPSGRKRIPEPSPVKQFALEHGLEIFQPESISGELIQEIRTKGFDTLITFAYGKIFRENFLSIFTGGAFNIHPSLLPRHRGASPINAAILAGDRETGISIQKMALKMDSGDIVMQMRFPLDGTETAQSLSEDVAAKTAAMIPEFITKLQTGTLSGNPQDDSMATYCRIISKEEGKIDWKLDAAAIEQNIRGFFPWPGTYTQAGDRTLTITKASVYAGTAFRDESVQPGTVLGTDKGRGIIIQTGKGLLAVERVKPQAKNEMDWKSFLNGAKNFTGTVLGDIT